MRLEDMTVTLRPRQPWEAVDLGCAMVRRDFGRLMTLWASTVLPLWIVVCVIFRDMPVWIPLVVWWLKPLYDRVPLFFLSRAAFGVRPGFAETWRAWPRLMFMNFLPALLWRRLSFIRSFALPAQLLEGLRGAAANRRVKTLAMEGGGSGASLTFAFSTIELFLWLGLMSGTYDLLPEAVTPDWFGIFQAFDFENTIPAAFLWWGAGCHMIIVTLIEPFYVGAGFALYLNSRTQIEGWDVELAFRRMATRLTAAATILIAALFVFGMPQSAQAAAGEDASQAIQEVLKKPEFEIHKVQTKRWIPEFEGDAPKVNSGGYLDAFGFLIQALFWMIVVGLVAWLIVYLVKNRHLFISRGTSKTKVQAPKVLMGMNITRESLPDDIVAAARAAWAAGDVKEALSLLYRGSLSWLVTRRRVPITDSDTEEDCLMHVVVAGQKVEADYFRQLTGAWVQVAYACLPTSDAEMTALCDQWPFVEKGGAV